MARRPPSKGNRGKGSGAGKPDRGRSGREESGGRGGSGSGGPVWLWGRHAVEAALTNPGRPIIKLLCAPNPIDRVREMLAALDEERRAELPEIEVTAPRDIEDMLPPDSVHQGMACLASQLEDLAIEDFLDRLEGQERALLVVLDQVSDPHNVGAILRSAAAFGAAAVVVQDRHSPPASGVLAKSASGALDVVPLVRVTNLSRALGLIGDAGIWRLGLDQTGTSNITGAMDSGRLALVLGAEGGGMRRLTLEACDALARVPTQQPIESLNVSNAAAVAIYEWARTPSV
jgi:23S rRNA (guanosine2251-2'-O)-methyltransferase